MIFTVAFVLLVPIVLGLLAWLVAAVLRPLLRHRRPDRPPADPPPPRPHHVDHRHPLHRRQHGHQPGHQHPRQRGRHPHLAGHDAQGRFLHPPDEPGRGLGACRPKCPNRSSTTSAPSRAWPTSTPSGTSPASIHVAQARRRQAGSDRRRPRLHRQGQPAAGHQERRPAPRLRQRLAAGRSGAGRPSWRIASA